MLSQLGTLERDAKQLGQDFLALEKFVNLNYQAFEKLLKNHDRCSVYCFTSTKVQILTQKALQAYACDALPPVLHGQAPQPG
jgi:SPX domain protein involved in polyphosphate accumulation